jgi:cysteine desulfurase / selenocysteine lyase
MIASVDARAAAIAADFPILAKPTSRGKRLVYLDSAASSQKPQAVIDTLVDFYSNYNANIHRGVYEIAAKATDTFEEARGKVARFVNAAHSEEIIWTRNTTEAINLVSFSWGMHNLKPGDAILTTQVEHHSNIVPWQLLAMKTGAELRYIKANDDGTLILDDLDELLKGTKLVALAHVSNVLGSIAPLEVIVPRAHAAGAIVLVDAAQSVPHMPVDVQALDVDFLAVSGHKMCAPTGIGFLYGKRALLEAMPPFLTGGDMIRSVSYDTTSFAELPQKFEAGTSNIADAIAFGTACDYLSGIGMQWIRDHEIAITRYALERLQPFVKRGLELYGPARAEDRGGVVSFNFADIHAHDLASILDLDGVCIRAGHHCAMPLHDKLNWPATARASFYLYSTEADVDTLAAALEHAAEVFKIS